MVIALKYVLFLPHSVLGFYMYVANFGHVTISGVVANFGHVTISGVVANFGHVTISGVVNMLLAHGRSEHIKMYRSLSFHCVLHKTALMTNTPHSNDVRASADVTFPFTIFFAMQLWNDSTYNLSTKEVCKKPTPVY